MNTLEFAEKEGKRAFEIGLERNMNPYDWEQDKEFYFWDMGFMNARRGIDEDVRQQAQDVRWLNQEVQILQG